MDRMDNQNLLENLLLLNSGRKAPNRVKQTQINIKLHKYFYTSSDYFSNDSHKEV